MREKIDYNRVSLEQHRAWRGKLSIDPKMPLDTREDLAIAYTPGVASSCLAIQQEASRSYELCGRGNLCLVATDGSAVLGLGDIGPLAAMPVMEGKCALFKRFGGVDAFPVCLGTKDVDVIVETLVQISGSFGGINLEDISAPRCFEIEEKLKERLDIPVFHDDQHGTAIVTLAGLYNALRLVEKELSQVKIVISGAGAAGIAITRLLIQAGAKNLILTDSQGALHPDRESMSPLKSRMADMTNPMKEMGALEEVLLGADVLIGVSAPGIVTSSMVRTMKEPILFACANPVPEIYPEEALAAGARIVATGRSDYPNQINNLLAFPGVFRGAFDVGATVITDEMKLAAAMALAELVGEALAEDYIIPDVFDPQVVEVVSEAVRRIAAEQKLTRRGALFLPVP